METLSMKPDISFIPEELISYKLRYLADQPIEEPYQNINTLDKKRWHQYIINRENYFNFILELGAFTRTQINSGNFGLAKKCCKHLLIIGNGNYGFKEMLEYCNKKIKIYDFGNL